MKLLHAVSPPLVVLLLAACGSGNQPAPAASGAPSATASGTAPAPAPSGSASPAPTATALAGLPGLGFGFDADRAGEAPAGFSFGRTGGGRPGKWVVRAEADAPTPPNVLAQMDADDTDSRFPIAVAKEQKLRDVRVSVRCKPVSGKVDQACGLVARYADEGNYYLTRVNALEGNVRLYTVQGGVRRQLASWSGKATSGTWHALSFELLRDHLVVTWDGEKVIDHRDATFGEAGLAGVWTKADSVTYFDELAIGMLTGGPR